MNLSAALDAYFIAKDLTPTSRRWYDQKLRSFLDWCHKNGVGDISELQAAHVRKFMADFRASNPHVSSHTLHGYMRVIKCWLNWCVGDDLVSEKVTRRLEMPKRDIKVIRTFTPQHIAKLFAAASVRDDRYPWFVERDKAILALLLDTGIRANELCDLTLDRVHLTGDDAYILVNGKGRKQREVGLGRASRQQLHRYIHRFRPHARNEQHVFLTRADKPLQPEGLDRMLYKLRDRAHIEGVRVSAHTFRHTFAFNYLANGGDVYKLSRLLGHTSVVVTEGYLRAFTSREARNGGFSVLDRLQDRAG